MQGNQEHPEHCFCFASEWVCYSLLRFQEGAVSVTGQGRRWVSRRQGCVAAGGEGVWCMSSAGDEMVEEGRSRKEKGKGGNVGS